MDQLKLIQEEIKLQRKNLSRELRFLREDKAEFENRMIKFRYVCTAAWDAVCAYRKNALSAAKPMQDLFDILTETDHLWIGYANCTNDLGDDRTSDRRIIQ